MTLLPRWIAHYWFIFASKAIFLTAPEGGTRPVFSLLPVREAQSAVTISGEKRGTTAEEKHTTAAKMSSFFNKLSGYTLVQLNEILEDDEKLTKMVQEMDEVCKSFVVQC